MALGTFHCWNTPPCFGQVAQIAPSKTQTRIANIFSASLSNSAVKQHNFTRSLYRSPLTTDNKYPCHPYHPGLFPQIHACFGPPGYVSSVHLFTKVPTYLDFQLKIPQNVILIAIFYSSHVLLQTHFDPRTPNPTAQNSTNPRLDFPTSRHLVPGPSGHYLRGEVSRRKSNSNG